MRLLFIGDIVGKVGREAITTYLSRLKQTYRPTVTIVNAENAAHGKGLTEKIYKDLLREGVDFMTMGNHTYGQRQIYDFIDSANRMVRPANFPEEAPGVGMRFIQINEIKLAIINLQGRAFMQDIDDPFKKADELINEAKKETDYIFVDFHAETTSEKMLWVGILMVEQVLLWARTHIYKLRMNVYYQEGQVILRMLV